jgi:D-beta-D-heptose 7-phosphate kinase/D-beta-D-heptose 1-phosphate adenosyltransferase
LGGKVTACGVVGRDEAGKRLVAALERLGVLTEGIATAAGFQTTQKTRIIASPRNQQVVRLDRENSHRIDDKTARRLCDFVERHVDRCAALVVSDYGKGVIHPGLLDLIGALSQKKKLLCVVDPKQENFSRYRSATLLTPNKDEASQASGVRIHDQRSLRKAGQKLLAEWNSEAVLITRGQEGMSLFRRGGQVRDFSTAAREVFDVTGAGDTVVATCALALASRSSYEEAAVLANLAAGIVVGEVGTFAVPLERLKKVIRKRMQV